MPSSCKIQTAITHGLFLLAIAMGISFKVNAQTCSGSLGDPIISESYGQSKTPGKALPQGITTLTYSATNCPGEGSYSIASSFDAADCHPDTWHSVPADHTGDFNGQMMIINAGNGENTYYRQTMTGLCPNTVYQFSGYLLNLNKPSADGTQPDIKFSVESSDENTELTSGVTGPLDTHAAPQWYYFSIYYTAPANKTEIVVRISNNSAAAGANTNAFIIDDIAFRACGRFVQAGFDKPDGSISKNICDGGGSKIHFKATVSDDSDLTYQWQVNEGDGWQEIPNSDTKDFIMDAPAKGKNYRYRLGVAKIEQFASVNCRVYSQELTLKVIPSSVISPIPAQQFCEGTRLSITANGGATFVWSGPNLPPTTINPLVIDNVNLANAGTYTVKPGPDGGCTVGSVQFEVNVLPKVSGSISDGVTICIGGHTQLNASGGISYKWTPSTGLDRDDIANPVAGPLQTTTYSVSISNGGCEDVKSVQVTVNQNVTADAGGNKTIFEGESVMLNGQAGGDGITGITWTPATGLDDPSSLTPVASPLESTTYTMHVSSLACGIATSSVFVKVFKKIVIPNTFSPNGDGINDTWNVDALSDYPDASVLVFDRYGKRIFESKGYGKPWNGTYNGSLLPEGAYYYIIDLKNNTQKRSGWVFIVR